MSAVIDTFYRFVRTPSAPTCRLVVARRTAELVPARQQRPVPHGRHRRRHARPAGGPHEPRRDDVRGVWVPGDEQGEVPARRHLAVHRDARAPRSHRDAHGRLSRTSRASTTRWVPDMSITLSPRPASTSTSTATGGRFRTARRQRSRRRPRRLPTDVVCRLHPARGGTRTRRARRRRGRRQRVDVGNWTYRPGAVGRLGTVFEGDF